MRTQSQSVSEEESMHPRDVLLRDTFTYAERSVFALTLVVFVALTWVPDPLSGWTTGMLIGLALLCPGVIALHQRTHPFFLPKLWRRWSVLMLPVWIGLLVFLLGLWNQSTTSIEIEGTPYLMLKNELSSGPVSTKPTESWTALLAFCGLYTLALNCFIVPKSRSFFTRLFPWMLLNCVLLAIVGYAQRAAGAEAILGLLPLSPARPFFATFPNESLWIGFACLWMAVFVALGLLHLRTVRVDAFGETKGPYYLTGAALIGGSVLICLPGPAVLITMITGTVLIGLIALQVSGFGQAGRKCLSVWFVGSIIALGGMLYLIVSHLALPDPTGINNAVGPTAAREMFLARPLFGWGYGSFPVISRFFTTDFAPTLVFESAGSDLFEVLANGGILGLVGIAVIPLSLLLGFLLKGSSFSLSWHLLIGAGGLLAMAIFDGPFAPAVSFSFWVIFFAAIRWADISRTSADLVDSKVHLVLPQTMRNVPSSQNPRGSVRATTRSGPPR